MNIQEAEVIVAHRRRDDNRFFRLARIWNTVRNDHTAIIEVAIGLVFFILLGCVILLDFTAFPPANVDFLLRSLPLGGFTEDRLGSALVIIGICQILAVATRSYKLRASVSTVGGIVCIVVTTAYFFAGVADYFQAWVGYFALALTESFIVIRLVVDADDVSHVARRIESRRRITPTGQGALDDDATNSGG